ncbi:hypothetical protein MtrunA17_Chr7g0231071 [Medicago truncatula]|uniref:Uncharacterized protein n=1 Tax=Medicago truncatula TaxID=3880 RepID=A0A396H3C8_MEDTR|nr:hypothetical protein MtrunA17_Chr7g0231071 [Medicago truncatula]
MTLSLTFISSEEINNNEFSKVPCILHMNSMKGTHTDLEKHIER